MFQGDKKELENKFTEKIVEEVWGKWVSIPILAFISTITCVLGVLKVISLCSYTVKYGNATYTKLTEIGVCIVVLILLSFSVLNLWNVFFVFGKNYIRKAKRKKSGILIYLDSPNISLFKETERKFGNEFRKAVFSGFDVIFIPFGRKPIDYRDKSIAKLLRRKRCLLYLFIGIDSDDDSGSIIYDMQISGSIIHRTYLPNVEKEFQRVFTAVLHDFRNQVFPSKDMVKKLRITAAEMSLACQYIIGLSLFLNGDFGVAETVLSELACSKAAVNQRKDIFTATQRIRYDIFMTFAQQCIAKYQSQCDDDELLEMIGDYLEKARECEGKTFEYCLNKAYYCVAKEQNTTKAWEYINICKQMKKVPLVWKYSEAFLKAYDNRSIGSVCSSYKMALKVDYNVQDLIVYVEMMLGKEPERIGLCLALGILYNYMGDSRLSQEYLEKYLASEADPDKAREIIRKKVLIE